MRLQAWHICSRIEDGRFIGTRGSRCMRVILHINGRLSHGSEEVEKLNEEEREINAATDAIVAMVRNCLRYSSDDMI